MSSDTASRPRRPFQFGIGSILLLTTLAAVVVAIGRIIEAPLVWQLGIAGYIFMLLLYAFFRIPYLLRIAFGKESDWQRVRARRRELEESVRRDAPPNQQSPP
jgi:hypothetical protein